MNVFTITDTSQRAWSKPWLGQRSVALWLAYVALALVLVAPLLLVEVPMGVDTLNHLARIHVRAHIADDADLARLFEVRDALVPYMGLDWLLTPMARVMPTLVAGRLFIILLLWGMVGAVMAVQRAFTGRIGFGPLLVGLVSYNGLLAWGFLNYLLGMIGALLGLAAWHAMRGRPWGWRLLLFSGVATALYFVHLLALALYAVMLVTYEVFGRPRPWRTSLWDWIVLGLQFVPAAAISFRLAVTLTGGGAHLFWFWDQKPVILASPFLFTGAAGGPDAGLVVLWVCAFLAVSLKRTGVLHWHRSLGLMAAVLAILGVVMPFSAFGVALVDLRFPFAAACLAAAAIGVTPGSGKRLWPAGLALAAATLVQVGSAAATMHGCDLQYAEVRAALQAVPRGEVLTAVEETENPALSLQCTRVHVYEHMAQLMTLDRSGYSSDFFAQVTPVAVRDGRGTDTAPIRTHLLTPDMLPRHGYVLWMHFGNHDRPVPPGLSPLREGSFFTLYTTQ